MGYTLTHNAQFGSLEITFDGKPEQAIRDALKTLRFRWNGVRRVWYGYADEEITRAALDGANVGGTVSAEDQNSKPEEQPEPVESLEDSSIEYVAYYS